MCDTSQNGKMQNEAIIITEAQEKVDKCLSKFCIPKTANKWYRHFFKANNFLKNPFIIFTEII